MGVIGWGLGRDPIEDLARLLLRLLVLLVGETHLWTTLFFLLFDLAVELLETIDDDGVARVEGGRLAQLLVVLRGAGLEQHGDHLLEAVGAREEERRLALVVGVQHVGLRADQQAADLFRTR